MPTREALIVAAFVVFVLAALWPALPASAQGIRINLVATGLALLTLGVFLGAWPPLPR